MGCAIGLVALGIGYLVLLNANKEKEGLKVLGQAIGILIMVVSVLMGLCAMKKCIKGGSCGSYSSSMMCPVSGKNLESAQTQQ